MRCLCRRVSEASVKNFQLELEHTESEVAFQVCARQTVLGHWLVCLLVCCPARVLACCCFVFLHKATVAMYTHSTPYLWCDLFLRDSVAVLGKTLSLWTSGKRVCLCLDGAIYALSPRCQNQFFRVAG